LEVVEMGVRAAVLGSVPDPGEPCVVRNRRAVATRVSAFDAGGLGKRHVVDVDYADGIAPASERLLWEVEAGSGAFRAGLRHALSGPPAAPADLANLVRHIRMEAQLPFPGMPDAPEIAGDVRLRSLCLLPPFCSGKAPEEYQLVPLEAAMEMPQVRLLIADDVGLGKTVEAALVAAELVARRRIRRILVLCPPGLRKQWIDEMEERLGLGFLEGGAGETGSGPRRSAPGSAFVGEPGGRGGSWTSAPRAVVSYYYLRRPEHLAEFLDACKRRSTPLLPWDLLIVDEVHNLAPDARGQESDLTRMLRSICPWFEHRVFLTATPHDGYTRSFTGLLEILDPARFRRTGEMTAAELAGLKECAIRRTKAQVAPRLSARRFSERRVVALDVGYGESELELFRSVDAFRTALSRWGGRRLRADAVGLCAEVLCKRLLSSKAAFIESFEAFGRGLPDSGVTGPSMGTHGAAVRPWTSGASASEDAEAPAACATRTEQDCLDAIEPRVSDSEVERRWHGAASAVGDWVRRCYPAGQRHICRIRQAVAGTAFDSRTERFLAWVRDDLKGEKAVVFTEYLATLRHIERALRTHVPKVAAGAGFLWSETPEKKRRDLLASFGDPEGEVRMLVATDVASEGVNLQAAARYVFHFDIPWNPVRMEQRIGRLDRFGHSRQVLSIHFREADASQARLVERLRCKWECMRFDIGSVGNVLAAPRQPALDRGPPCPSPGLAGAVDSGPSSLRSRPLLPASSGVLGVDTRRLCDRVVAPRLLAATFGGEAMPLSAPPPTRHGPTPHGRWTVLRSPLPAGLDAAIVVLFRSVAWNQAGQRLHAWAAPVAIPVRRRDGRWTIGRTRSGAKQPKLVPAAGDNWKRPRLPGSCDLAGVETGRGDASFSHPEELLREILAHGDEAGAGRSAPPEDDIALARAIWAACAKAIASFEAGYGRGQLLALSTCLSTQRRACEAQVRKRYSAMLAEFSGPASNRREASLQAKVRRLGTACNAQGFLFAGMRLAASAELSELNSELKSFRSLAQRRKRLLEECRDAELSESIPLQFTQRERPLVAAEAVIVVLR